MAAVLALIAAICFAVAAALQQRGQFKLAHAGRAVTGLASVAPITLANRDTDMPGEP